VSEFVWPVRVYYEDTDSGGVVYYANYLRFMERARTEWLRAAGIEQDQLRDELGLLFVITGCDIRYHKPARFNEVLEVSVVPVEVRRTRFAVTQEVRRGNQVLVTARVSAACIDHKTFRPKPLPEHIIAEIQA